jgi:hypothetical protein
MKRVLFAIGLLTIPSVANACVTINGGMFVNGCPYPVMVRYDAGYGSSMTSLISPGRAAMFAYKPGVRVQYEYCDTGGKNFWTCN